MSNHRGCMVPYRQLLIAGLAVTSGLLFGSPAHALNEEHLERFLRTQACVRCDLSGADFRRLNLTGEKYNLTGANLRGANFYLADISGANFSEADLTEAYFGKTVAIATIFEGARLDNATLLEADFRYANLINALLDNTYIEDSLFFGAKLQAADLREAILVDSNFEGAILCTSEQDYGDFRYEEDFPGLSCSDIDEVVE